MSREDRGGRPGRAGGGRYSPLLVFGIALFAVASFYGLLAVASQLDDYFLPGNELRLGPLGNLPGIDSGQMPEAATPEQRINILLLGLDLRPDDPPGTPARTDSIAILTLDPYSNTGGVLSIPRDLWVQIPTARGGYFYQRINVAYEAADWPDVRYPGGGVALVKDTIKNNFGINIDHYVVMDWSTFVQIIDTLGGIDVDVQETVYDPAYNECNRCPYQEVLFRPGRQHMDGRRALAYVRIRYGSDDLDRIERQQQVMMAVLDKATSAGILLNPVRLRELYDRFRRSVNTDVSPARALGLALKLRDVPREQIKTFSLRDVVYPMTTEDGAAVLGWDPDKMKLVVRQFFLDGKVDQEAARIEVQNGSDVPGLATQIKNFLASQGLPEDRLSVATAPGPRLAETTICDLAGKSYTAKKLAEWLSLPETRVVNGNCAGVAPVNGPADIIIVAGRDARTLVQRS
ncbi:MAG: LCP family protein [Dehalococcoidia bacterium]|jgi:LCP family protein required for cell wall assembly|nr:LCP family protein [Dehalococcoidia bacterium]MDW8009538.1 LCP family protein [Chloroflexota bacterium]